MRARQVSAITRPSVARNSADARAPNAVPAGRGQTQAAGAAVLTGPDLQQAVALQRPDRSAERRAVHSHQLREFVDGGAVAELQVAQHRKLRRAQAGLGQMPIVDLRDVPRRLPQSEAIAGVHRGRESRGLGHGFPSGATDGPRRPPLQ
jgi:hypothetical protein